MPFPRLLNLSPRRKEALLAYLKEIVEHHKMERGDWIQDLKDEQKAYWAKPSQEVRNFPFRGASNIVIPLTAIAVEAVHAREMTSLFALKPFINCTTKSILTLPESGTPMEDVETPLEEFMHYEILKNSKGKKVIGDMCLDKNKYGTCVGKVGYERIVRSAVREGPDGQDEEFTVVVKDGSFIDRTPLPNFWMPFSSQDEQEAPWCGEYHHKIPYQVKLLTESGMFYKDTFENLRGFFTMNNNATDDNALEDQQNKNENREPVWPEYIDFFEINCCFNIDYDGDSDDEGSYQDAGHEKEIQVFYSHDAHLLMAVRYNDYDDLHRQWRHGVYFPVEGRWPGLGLCKMSIEFQREITIQHRQRLDNATLANIRMIVIHKLSGYGPGEPVFPGKMWFVDDMEHIETLQMGDVYSSSFANEQSALLYGQQRWGVNELTLGQPSSGTPGTATGDIARIQEASKKFEFIFDNSREFISQLASDLLVNIAQYGSKTKRYFDVVEGGPLIREFLSLPVDLIRDGLLIEIGTTTQSSNRAIDRQNWQQISQVLTQYYTGALQLSQMVGDPTLIGIITQKAMYGINEVAKQLLETFDMRNIDRILFKKELEKLYGGNASGVNAVLGAGGNPAASGDGQSAGLPAVPEIINMLAQLGAGKSGNM